MATRSFRYDHPAYLVPQVAGGITEAGNGVLSNRFAAVTDMIAKSAQITVATAGATAGHLVRVLKLSGTATTTIATATLGTAAAGTTQSLDLNSTALAAGDQLACLNGTDTQGVAAVSYELLFKPGATFTA